MHFRPGNPGTSFYLVAAALAVAFLPVETHAALDGARALRSVVTLAQDIGPRKTGTEADRAAIEFVRGELEAAGLEVTLQEVPLVEGENAEWIVGSWNVIGRLDGEGPDTIIVSAHHDTRNFVVPGANDDASGIAVLLEVARATAQRRRLVNYLFISFCGEEEGLLGSEYFASGADLSRVRAMVALELLGRGEIVIGPIPDEPPVWAQELLLRAAHRSGIGSVAARPIWTLAPRFVDLHFGADHESFLSRGVPAFLLLGTFPAWTYHTPADRVGEIEGGALKRAAFTLDRMLVDLEEHPPSRFNDPHYLPVTLFGWGIVVTTSVLQGIALAALLVVGILTMKRLRSVASVRGIFELVRVLIVATACTAIGLSGMFGSAALMVRLQGARFPWIAHQPLHVALGIACTVVTGWIGLNFFRRIKPTVEPGPYLAGALLLPTTGLVAGLVSGWPELAAVSGVPAMSFILSLRTHSIGRKLALGLLGLLPLLLVGTLEDYRAIIQLTEIQIPGKILFALLLVAASPYVLFLAHVASFRECLHSRFWWWIFGPWIGGPALIGAIGLGVACTLLPAYDDHHRQIVRMRQRVDMDEERASATVHSADYLDGVELEGAGRTFAGKTRTERFPVPFPSDTLRFEASTETIPLDDERAIHLTASFEAPIRADRMSFLFTSKAGFRVPGRDQRLRKSYSIVRIAPRENSDHLIRLVVPRGGDLALAFRVDFQDDLLGLRPEGDAHVFVHRSTVTASRLLLEGEPPPDPEGSAGMDAPEEPGT